MDIMWSLCCIGPWMGHVIVYLIGCILGRAPHTKDLCLIFVKLWVLVKGIQQCGIGVPDIHKFLTG